MIKVTLITWMQADIRKVAKKKGSNNLCKQLQGAKIVS